MLNIIADSIFIDMLKFGGIPALAVFVCFILIMKYMRSRDKADAALQKEREEARVSEHEQLVRMTDAYESLVHKIIVLINDSTRALTIMSERVGGCPFRGAGTPPVESEQTDD